MVGDSLPAVREVTVIPVGQEQRAMSIAEFDDQLALIKHVVAQMQEGVHYGIIPGTRDKSLWEPGAEYLRAAFRISWSYELTKEVENFETGDFRYEFRAFTVPPTQPAEWVASAWSKERKFWCSRDCPTGCDQKHPPKGMPIGDIPNNVKDRALKRAFVNLMRNVTGTSGWFKMALDTETGEVSNKYLCPIHNVEWFKRGKMKAYAHPIPKDDKAPWCRMEQVIKEQESQAAEDTEDAQDTPQRPQGVAFAPSEVSHAQNTPATLVKEYTFEEKRKMLFDWAEVKYHITPDQVATAAGITLNQITEATDLKWVSAQVAALYKQ